jgi:hypothetical protein
MEPVKSCRPSLKASSVRVKMPKSHSRVGKICGWHGTPLKKAGQTGAEETKLSAARTVATAGPL